MSYITIAEAKDKFLESMKFHRSVNTLLTYRKAIETFSNMLKDQQIEIYTFPVGRLNEDHVVDFVNYVNKLSPSTESLYLQVLKNFFEFLNAENLVIMNVSQVRMLLRQRTRRHKAKVIEYPEEETKLLIESLASLSDEIVSNHEQHEQTHIFTLRSLRDCALILALADTGLRVDELCKLKITDIDWAEKRAVIKGLSGKKGFARFSTRALKALKNYLDLRFTLDTKTGRQISTLPLFARHDKGVGKKIEPVTPTTIRNIVRDRVNQALGPNMVGSITPHTFMHFFVTTILRGTGNLKLAQVLARHSNIQVTQRYAHLSDDELDKGYYEIFERKE